MSNPFGGPAYTDAGRARPRAARPLHTCFARASGTWGKPRRDAWALRVAELLDSSTLDYWYAPKHDGSASTAAGAGVDVGSGKWRQQLNPLKPAGLASPFEACFLTMVMLRLGLAVSGKKNSKKV